VASLHQFLAIDFGAESGRGMIVRLQDGRVGLQEIRRWPNRPVRLAGTLCWDLPFLYAEMLEAIKTCARQGVPLAGISVDTWGVDFGLLDAQGNLLGLPVHYRDGRTEKIHATSGRVMSNLDIYRATGAEPWAIGSLFQLLAMQRDGSPLLVAARTFLNMPDLFLYLLSGQKASELSILSTSNLLGVDGRWCRPVIDAFGLPDVFGRTVEPGTVLGPLSGPVAAEVGLADVPVIASAGHDTCAVVLAVPAAGEDWAFLSCGTWSVLGATVGRPVATAESLAAGFSNEYTAGGWFMCRNILGLWLVQELRRRWNIPADPWDYPRLTAEAAAARTHRLVDVADGSLLAPPDMEAALQAILERSGQGPARARGELVRCVLESLALEYALSLENLGRLSGRPRKALYMVGGGIANTLLCQLTADACNVPVYAGADQCTALGNALCQAMALGILSGPAEIREVMRNSGGTVTYEPRDAAAWRAKREVYRQVRGRVT
jgi:rhamnulokinase